MDRLWHLKFYSQFPVPGNQVSAYFDDGGAARGVMDRHAAGMGAKLGEACEVMAFDDLMGRHCFRLDFFPYTVLYEMGPADRAWKEIQERIQVLQKAAGLNKEVGFAGGEQKKEGE